MYSLKKIFLLLLVSSSVVWGAAVPHPVTRHLIDLPRSLNKHDQKLVATWPAEWFDADTGKVVFEEFSYVCVTSEEKRPSSIISILDLKFKEAIQFNKSVQPILDGGLNPNYRNRYGSLLSHAVSKADFKYTQSDKLIAIKNVAALLHAGATPQCDEEPSEYILPLLLVVRSHVKRRRSGKSSKNILYEAADLARKNGHDIIADYFAEHAHDAIDVASKNGKLTAPLFTTDQLSAMFHFDVNEEKNEDGETPWWLR